MIVDKQKMSVQVGRTLLFQPSITVDGYFHDLHWESYLHLSKFLHKPIFISDLEY